MKLGTKKKIWLRYRLGNNTCAFEKQVHNCGSHGDCVYDLGLANYYLGVCRKAKLSPRNIDEDERKWVNVGVLFELAKMGYADVWMFGSKGFVWGCEGGKVVRPSYEE